MTGPYFTNDTLSFLRKLEKNNNRDWFTNNKDLYEEVVRTPALQFIADMSNDLAEISPHFLAVPKKMGGSLMRVYRDVRFGKDKRPYKTNIGIQFRHELGKDVHAPGFYVHIEPNECFIGAGIWRPDSSALAKIRDRICERGDQWLAVINTNAFKKRYVLAGESLTNPPRGYTRDHPMIDELKRKDFIAISAMDDDIALSSGLRKQVVAHYKAADDYMRYLCEALSLQY